MAPTNVPAVIDGVVGDVKVKVGDTVKEGDLVAIQHVGKTEYQIKSTASGKIVTVVSKGHQAITGEAIVVVE